MNKRSVNLLLLIFIAFLNGCNNLAEDVVNSSSLRKQEVNNMANSKQSNPKGINDVQISFYLANSEAVLSEPVFLNFEVQNSSQQTIKLSLGQNYKEGFLFTIIQPDGKKIQLPQYVVEGISRKGDVIIKPRQTYSQKILLNEWTDFAAIGKYKIEGKLANPVKSESGENLEIDSNFSISFDVKSENAEHLETVCGTLLKQLIESNSYAEAAEAALALSYVRHPIAVSYLQKALISNKNIESVIINRLRERSDKDSVEVLIYAINEKPNSEMATQAKSALRWIESQSSDLEIKQRIKKVTDNY